MTSVFPWQNEDRLEIHKAKFAKVIMYFFHEGNLLVKKIEIKKTQLTIALVELKDNILIVGFFLFPTF